MPIALNDNYFSKSRIGIAGCFAMLLIFLVAFSDSIRIVVESWSTEDQFLDQAGFLVTFYIIWTFFRQRKEIAALTPAPLPWLLPILLLCSMVWMVAKLTSVQLVQLGILPILLISSFSALLGVRFFKVALVPMILLMLTLPLWTPLLPLLKDATTGVTVEFLRLINKPVMVQGYYLYLPGGAFFVDDGCAGLRFLLVTLILGFMSIDLQGISLRHGLLLILAGIGLALVANWIRVIIVVLLGDYTLMQHPWVEDHYTLGWIVYAIVVLLPFFVFSNKYFSRLDSRAADAQTTVSLNSNSRRAHLEIILIFSITAMLSGPVVYGLVVNQSAETRTLSIPQATGDWELRFSQEGFQGVDWNPEFISPSNETFARYSSGDKTVEFFRISYARQVQGAELISVDNRVTGSEDWSVVPESTRTISLDQDGVGMRVNTTQVMNSQTDMRRVVIYWYNVAGHETNDDYLAKVYQLTALLEGRSDGTAFVLSAPCNGDCSDEIENIGDFTRTMRSAIQQSI